MTFFSNSSRNSRVSNDSGGSAERLQELAKIYTSRNRPQHVTESIVSRICAFPSHAMPQIILYPSEQSSLFFTRLPPEIRHLVYTEIGISKVYLRLQWSRRKWQWLVWEDKNQWMVKMHGCPWQVANGESNKGSMISFMYTCKKAYLESVKLLYGSTDFNFVTWSPRMFYHASSMFSPYFYLISTLHIGFESEEQPSYLVDPITGQPMIQSAVEKIQTYFPNLKTLSVTVLQPVQWEPFSELIPKDSYSNEQLIWLLRLTPMDNLVKSYSRQLKYCSLNIERYDDFRSIHNALEVPLDETFKGLELTEKWPMNYRFSGNDRIWRSDDVKTSGFGYWITKRPGYDRDIVRVDDLEAEGFTFW